MEFTRIDIWGQSKKTLLYFYSDPLLSHIFVIPAEAGIQCLLFFMAFNDLLDTRFRGYDVNTILSFHVH